MKLYKKYRLFGTIIFFVSCSGSPEKEFVAPVKPVPSMQVAEHAIDLSAVVLAINKDLVCGMPIRAGVADTAHYKGKVYGFCAKECKEAFVKDPGQYIQIKKQ
jgi:YHS domain-containing protein